MKRVFVFSIIFGLGIFNVSFATTSGPSTTTGSMSVGGTVAGGGGCGSGGCGSGPDTTAPTTAIVSAVDGDLASVLSGGNTVSGTIKITFTGNDNVTPSGSLTFKCSVDGGVFGSCLSPKSYTGLALGPHTFVVKSTDEASLEDATGATFLWKVVPPGADVTPPTTTITSSLDGDLVVVSDNGMSSSTSITFGLSGTDNVTPSGSITFQCSLDGAVFTVCIGPKNYSGLPLGTHVFKVRSKDVAGNVDATPAIVNWSIVPTADTTAPITTIISTFDGTGSSVPSGGTTTSTDIVFNFSGTDNVSAPMALTFICSLDSGVSTICISGATFTGLSIGSHIFSVQSRDVAGNLDLVGSSLTWTVALVSGGGGKGPAVVVIGGGSGGIFITPPAPTSTNPVIIPATTTPRVVPPEVGTTTALTIVSDAVEAIVVSVVENVSLVAIKTEEFVKSPVGKTAVKVAQPVGAISGGVVIGAQVLSASSTVTSVYDIYLLVVRSLGVLFGFYVGKKKPWGTVYDSVTKRPLDPAYVVVKDSADKEIADAITDLDGRYGFFLPSGRYTMTAGKTNYEFPSKVLAGKIRDELYDNLYFGESIDQAEGEVIVRNIPMDPIGFDWNEFEKNKKKLFRIYSRREKIFKSFFNLTYLIGFAMTVASVIFSPNATSYTFFAINIFLVIYFLVVVKKKAVRVMYGEGFDPIPYAIIKLFSPDTSNEIKSVVADYLGRFYVLTGPGQYRLRVDNKRPDSSYESVYDNPVDLPKGVISKDIIVEKNEKNLQN